MMGNPVLTREIRTRIRSRKSRRAQLAVGIPAGLIAVLSYWQLVVGMYQNRDYERGEIWMTASVIQLVLMCFLTPGMFCNAITQEKEQRTWGLLLITRLTSWQIVYGKLSARMLPMLILLALFVPFMAYSAIAGKIPAAMVFGTSAVLFSCLLFFAVQALFWSWLFKRTSVATAASYGTVFFLVVGTAIIEGLIQSIVNGLDDLTILMWLNPFFVLTEGFDVWRQISTAELLGPLLTMMTVYIGASALMLLRMNDSLEKPRFD